MWHWNSLGSEALIPAREDWFNVEIWSLYHQPTFKWNLIHNQVSFKWIINLLQGSLSIRCRLCFHFLRANVDRKHEIRYHSDLISCSSYIFFRTIRVSPFYQESTPWQTPSFPDSVRILINGRMLFASEKRIKTYGGGERKSSLERQQTLIMH